MATVAAKAARKAQVRQCLDREVEELAGRLNLQIPDEPRPTRDPELDAILGLERQEAILHSINVALEEHGVVFVDLSDENAVDKEAEDLTKLTRPELNAMAVKLRIEAPEKLNNKTEVIAAIEEARSTQNTEPDRGPEGGSEDQAGTDQSTDQAGGTAGTGEPKQDSQPEGTGGQTPPAE